MHRYSLQVVQRKAATSSHIPQDDDIGEDTTLDVVVVDDDVDATTATVVDNEVSGIELEPDTSITGATASK